MAKTREIQCVYYLNEGNCAKGRDGTFTRKCQTCNLYKAKKGARPRRKDLRKEKNEKFMKDKRNWGD